MKKFKFNKVSKIILAFVLTLGFVGLNSAQAVTPPDRGLGLADSYSVFGKAGITTTGVTHVWGNAGADSSIGLIQSQVDGSINVAPASAGVETDARSTYDSLMSALQGTPAGTVTALDLAGTHTTANGNPIVPGVYTVGATTMNGAVELSGAGVYIFRGSSNTTISSSAVMTLTNGATACDVFWAITDAMTIGTGAHVEGTIIAHNGLISLATGATLVGRAISLISQVTLQANQITQPICTAPVVRRSSSGSSPRITQPTSTNPAILTIIKQVVNNGGGTATASLFNLHVKNSGVDVLGSPNNGVAAPGIYYSLPVGTYVISEDSNPSYARTFSGDCDLNGSVTLSASQNKTCVVTNTHILVPSLPKTGFPPQESGTWYESLLNNILNLFR